MVTLRDHATGDLFGPWSHLGDKRVQMLERSWAGVFRAHLLERLEVDKLAAFFSTENGRPSKDLYAALGVLILQQLHDLTDPQVVEQLAFNLAWHYALDIRDDSDVYICERSLRNYRRIVIDQELDKLLFMSLTDELIKVFQVDTSQQRIDSTAIRSAMRLMTRVETVVETLCKFFRECARLNPEQFKLIDEEIRDRYIKEEESGCFSYPAPKQAKRCLSAVGADILVVLKTVRGTAASNLSSFQLLERVFSEQFDVEGTDQQPAGKLLVKEPKDIPCDNVRNPSDPDSSYNAYHGQGYLVQVMETYEPTEEQSSKPDFITHINVHKMTIGDSKAVEPAVQDTTARGIKPQLILGDTRFGSEENHRRLGEEGLQLMAPTQPPKGYKKGKLTLEQFRLDEQGLVIQCPAGQIPISATAGQAKIQALFPAETCGNCPYRDSCPTAAPIKRGKQPRVQYTPARVEKLRKREYEKSDAFKQIYRWRAGIEATVSRLKYQMNLARLRVRGMSSVRYTVWMRSLGLNILRAANYT